MININMMININIFHTSGLYLFSAASIDEAHKKCNEQGLKNVAQSMRKGVINLYVTEV